MLINLQYSFYSNSKILFFCYDKRTLMISESELNLKNICDKDLSFSLNCFPNYKIEFKKTPIENLQIISLIDSGTYGIIYISKGKTKKDLEEKEGILFIKKYSEKTKEKIINEVCLQILASSFNITPKVLDFWLCKETSLPTGMIIMEQAGNLSLEKFIYLLNIPLESKSKLASKNSLISTLSLIRAFHLLFLTTRILNQKSKIIHNDLHPGNVMLTLHTKEEGLHLVKKVSIIDFGTAQSIESIMSFGLEQIKKTEKNNDSFEYIDILQAESRHFNNDRFIIYELLKDKLDDYQNNEFLKPIIQFCMSQFYNPIVSIVISGKSYEIPSEFGDKEMLKEEVKEFIEKKYGDYFDDIDDVVDEIFSK